jgi:hypothetical protein
MTKGMKAYDAKERRRMRIRNHIARDLGTPKYRQRVKEGKPQKPAPEIDEWEEDLQNDNQ